MKRFLFFKRKIWKKALFFFFYALGLYGIILLLIHFQLFQNFNHILNDRFYTTEKRVSKDIIILAIDDESLKNIENGGLGRWQEWQRDVYAKVIEELNKAGAQVIGLDILFLENSADIQKDIQLGQVVQSHNNVILASKFDTLNQEYLMPVENISHNDFSKIGPINILVDSDNLVRKNFAYIEHKGKIHESFDVKIVKKYLGVSTGEMSEIPVKNEKYILTQDKIRPSFDITKIFPPLSISLLEKTNLFFIQFFGRPFSFEKISFTDVYYGRFDPNLIKNKIVLIGEMGATGLHDVEYTPVSKGVEMPGVEIHANTIQTLLTQDFLQNVSEFYQIGFLWIWGIILVLIFILSSISLGILFLFLACGINLLAALVAFENGWIIPTFYLFLVTFFAYIVALIWKYYNELRQKKYLKTAFSRYVSKNIVESIMKNPENLTLGGEKKIVTILFSDIRGFTTLGETMEPESLVQMLNTYLHDMTEIVFSQNGTLDKYIGDAVMAFWGAPIDDKTHAFLACSTALIMQEKMKEIRKNMLEKYNVELYIRIGVHTGEVVVGNIGSLERFDYTIIGDSVNLASRLEGVNKLYGTSLLISEATYSYIKEEFACREIDEIRVKGKAHTVKIFEMIGKKAGLTMEMQTLIHLFEQGRVFYTQKKWKQALEFFEKTLSSVPNDPPSLLYQERCQYFMTHPPKDSWDGIFEMTIK